jgi:hypothetical protein
MLSLPAKAAALGLQLPENQLLPLTLQVAEQWLAALPHEVALAFDQHGALLLCKAGEATKVAFTDAELTDLRDTIFTHNHPSQSFLTVRDMEFACHNDVAQLRAVAGPVVHILTRPAAGWPLAQCRRLVATEQARLRKRFAHPGADRQLALRQWNAFAPKLVERLSLPLSQETL